MNEMKWISVDDELPEKSERNESDVVLVWANGSWFDAYYDYDFSEWTFCRISSHDIARPEDITHFAYVTTP